MNDRNLEKFKKEYNNITIPDELESVVKKALEDSGVNINKNHHRIKKSIIIAASTAATITILTVGINVSPAFAKTLSEVPIVGGLVKVLSLNQYTVKDGTYEADIKVPVIKGLQNKTLENSLNKKYLQENKELYNQFMADMKELKAHGGGHLGVESGYEIKTDNDRILSVCRYSVNLVGSSSTVMKYDTIDKKNQILITLQSLFKDDSYVRIISQNVISQMKKQMKKDKNNTYWIDGYVENGFPTFKKIPKDQNFYINNHGDLVIVFDKYDVAPGCMGNPEFVIPTKVLSNVLVDNNYINHVK